MTMGEYQKQAARTINPDLYADEMINHAVLGLNSEAGELAGIFQKKYQGHEIDRNHVLKELGDVLWFVSELATAMDLTLEHVAMDNVLKLRKRFPDGFDSDRSINREPGDI